MMKKKTLLLRFAVLVTAMMCALGIHAQEAYACYTPSDSTLTFYYDNQRSSRPGTTYDLNPGHDWPGWRRDGTYADVTKAVFDSSFADASPTSTYCWFTGMQHLQSITGMEYLNTSDVTDMESMFANCNKLTSLDVSHFNTSQVTNMNGVFWHCDNLTSLDLSNFNTSQVTRMTYMFLNSSNLRTIYVGYGWSTAAVTNSDNMFGVCTSLVGGQGTTYNSSNPMDKTYAHIDGGSSDPGYFTAKDPEAYACYTESNTTLTFYYDNQRSSRPGTTYDLNTGEYLTDWELDGTYVNVTKVVFDPLFADARPTSTACWFLSMDNLESITGIEYLNTSCVTNMNYMFSGTNFTSLDLSGFNTSQVTDMSYMFLSCTYLTSLDLSGFNTSQVTNMRNMFYACSGLTSLDLSSFNTSQVTNMRSMFEECSSLRTIYAGNGWSTAAVTNSDDMFYYCPRLVGGQGTTYSYYHVDAEYAHIDGGPSNPGYFTAAFMRGDVNGDDEIDINDVTALINYVLTGNAQGIDLYAANVNGDSDVDINDVTMLIGRVLSGVW